MTNTNTTKIAVLEAQVKDFKDQNEQVHKHFLRDLCELREAFDTWAGQADKKYASKTVEKVVYGALGAVCLWFLSRVFNLI